MSNHPYFITWTKQVGAKKLEVSSSKGSFYIRNNGQKIHDLCSTSYHAAFGHSFTPITKAITSQLKTLPMASPKCTFELKKRVSEKLIELIGQKGKIFYTVSGAESIENALKAARQISGKKIVLSRNISYHGATLGALSVTGDWRNKDHATVDSWTRRIPEPSVDPKAEKLEALIQKVGPEKIAAICLETITGGNGVIIPPMSWWRAISRIKKKYGLFLILDEVVCGFGRTGKNFGLQHFNLKPDFICLAKVITGGYIPFGAVWFSSKVAKYYDRNTLSAGLTNYAHPLGLAAMEVVMDYLSTNEHKENFSKLEKILSSYSDIFNEMSKVSESRQLGLLMAIELKSPIGIEIFLKNNLFVASVGNNIVLAPAYITKPNDLKKSLKLIKKIIEENS